MKNPILLAMVIMNMLIALGVQAQGNQPEEDYWALNYSDPFLELNCPLMEPVTMWVLRQKLPTRAVETIVDTELAPANGQDSMRKARLETYATFVDKKPFSSMLGIRYFQADILAQNRAVFGQTDQNFWLWNATKYVIDARTNVMLLTEYNKRGIEDSFKHASGGDSFWEYFMYDYAFSKQWQIMGLAVYQVTYMPNERKNSFIASAQARWEPSRDFKLLFGAPTLAAFEWSLTPQLGLAARYFAGNEIGAFCRYKISDALCLSLVYEHTANESGNTYFDPRSYSPVPEETIIYTNEFQIIDEVSLQLGILTSPEAAWNVAVGYAMAGDIALNNNLAQTGTVAGANEYFARLQVHYLNLWK